MTKERTAYDWEAIEKEYRAGMLSVRQIAKNHGCTDTAIRKKMKALNVERDLSQKIAEQVRTQLVRKEGCTANPVSEKEIVETAAAQAVEVVRSHQKRLSRGGKIVETLLEQLAEVAEKRSEIEQTIEEETAGDETSNRRNMMLKAVALPQNASTAVSLTLALKNLIGNERQVFNLDNEKDKNPEQYNITISGLDEKL